MPSSFHNTSDFSASESLCISEHHSLFYQYISAVTAKVYFKETILRSQEKSKEGKVKEGISLNLESIVFDLIQHLIDWLFKSVKWRVTLPG